MIFIYEQKGKHMNFLQKIISRSILKSLEKISKEDPKVRSKWEELGKASQELAKSINDYQKKYGKKPSAVDMDYYRNR